MRSFFSHYISLFSPHSFCGSPSALDHRRSSGLCIGDFSCACCSTFPVSQWPVHTANNKLLHLQQRAKPRTHLYGFTGFPNHRAWSKISHYGWHDAAYLLFHPVSYVMLCLQQSITRYLVTFWLYQQRSEKVNLNYIHRVLSKRVVICWKFLVDSSFWICNNLCR